MKSKWIMVEIKKIGSNLTKLYSTKNDPQPNYYAKFITLKKQIYHAWNFYIKIMKLRLLMKVLKT